MQVGIDEVGRGCWAGPLLVVAARAKTVLRPGLTDSKLLSRKRREQLFTELQVTCAFGEGWVEPAEIDDHGLTAAMQLGVARALKALGANPDDQIIMDGLINYCEPSFSRVQCIARADSQHPVVSAASIHAKVRRDAMMAELAGQYPEYGFEKHVGYGTKLHQAALRAHGLTPAHRRSYKPVAAFVTN